jgi:hypothetical protein
VKLRDVRLIREIVTMWRGHGTCPWGCVRVMEAEATHIGYCPNVVCVGPILAVLPPRVVDER